MHCCNAKNKRGNTDVVLLLTHGNLNAVMPSPSCPAEVISQEVSVVSLMPKRAVLSRGWWWRFGPLPARRRLGCRAGIGAAAA